jgi:hypothetical protein
MGLSSVAKAMEDFPSVNFGFVWFFMVAVSRLALFCQILKPQIPQITLIKKKMGLFCQMHPQAALEGATLFY